MKKTSFSAEEAAYNFQEIQRSELRGKKRVLNEKKKNNMLFRGNASTEARCHIEEFYCSEWAQAHIIQGLSMSYKKVNAERTLTVTWYPSSLACAPADRNGRCHPSFRLPGAHSPCGSLNFLLLRWKAFKEMKETLQESLRTGKINSCSKQTSNYPAPKRRNVVWKLKKNHEQLKPTSSQGHVEDGDG